MYTSDDIDRLFESFRNEAMQLLIFMKNIEVVEIYKWEVNEAAPRRTYHLSLEGMDADQRNKRQSLTEFCDVKITPQLPTKTAAFVNKLKVTPVDQLPRYVLNLHIVSDHNGIVSDHEWLVAGGIGHGKVTELACSSIDQKLVPAAGVAALIKVNGMPAEPIAGHPYCTLPLPAYTQLPVHINGYFELSSNRRDVWFGDDVTGSSMIKIEWNKRLGT